MCACLGRGLSSRLATPRSPPLTFLSTTLAARRGPAQAPVSTDWRRPALSAPATPLPQRTHARTATASSPQQPHPPTPLFKSLAMLPSSTTLPSLSAASSGSHPLAAQTPYPAGLHTGLLPPHMFPSLPYNPVLGQSVYGPYGAYPMAWPYVCPPTSFLAPELNPLLYPTNVASLNPLLKPATERSGLDLASSSVSSPSGNLPNLDLPPIFPKPIDFYGSVACPSSAYQAPNEASLFYSGAPSHASKASLAVPNTAPNQPYTALLPRFTLSLSETVDIEGTPGDTCKSILPRRGKNDPSSDASSSTSSTAEPDSDSECDETQLASPAKKKCRSLAQCNLESDAWASLRASTAYRASNTSHTASTPTANQKGCHDLALLTDASVYTSGTARDITQCSATSALLDASAMMAASMQAATREASGMINSDSNLFLPASTGTRPPQPDRKSVV